MSELLVLGCVLQAIVMAFLFMGSGMLLLSVGRISHAQSSET